MSIIGTAIWSSIYLADDGYSAGAIAYVFSISIWEWTRVKSKFWKKKFEIFSFFFGFTARFSLYFRLLCISKCDTFQVQHLHLRDHPLPQFVHSALSRVLLQTAPVQDAVSAFKKNRKIEIWISNRKCFQHSPPSMSSSAPTWLRAAPISRVIERIPPVYNKKNIENTIKIKLRIE